MREPSIAVLIPCFNESVTIGKVVRDFRDNLPQAGIFVFDNNSTDNSAYIASQHGATVFKEKRQGKGFVVQSMFRRVDAEIYVMVDGDDTYPAEHVDKLIKPVMSGNYDMSVGVRKADKKEKAYPRFHVFGNLLITGMINFLFRVNLQDILSGYRCFSRRFVKSCPITSEGFEVETELTLQAINKRFGAYEVEIPYKERPKGSSSKLSTLKDGLLIAKTIFRIFRDYKPLVFFLFLGMIGLISGAAAGGVVLHEFIQTRYITHVPLAIFAVGCILLSFLLGGIGLILDAINRRFDELFDVQIKSLENRTSMQKSKVME